MARFRRPFLTRPTSWVALLVLVSAAASQARDAAPTGARPPEPLPTVAEKTAGLTAARGVLDVFLGGGKVYVALPPAHPSTGVSIELIYVEALATGFGSNPIGLDRGQLGASRLVQFRRFGPKVLLIEPNLKFRAESSNAAEVQSVADSFAPSTLWGGDVVAEDANGRCLVDLTSLVVSDAHGVSRTLRSLDQGEFALDRTRSAVDPKGCLAFPENIVLESLLTYEGKKPGRDVTRTAMTPEGFTLRQHHQFIALPPPGYRPRAAHPRVGYFATRFLDYAVPLAASMQRGYILRHRLEKRDPSAATSAPKEPIVYYVDRGAPPQIRDALIEGASWWASAFEAAGFTDAFRVEVLPPDAHPLDVRYNVIHWVHRSTRGWSYGGNVHDPRTGEILKGNVLLGSLRVRQDRRLFEALIGADGSGDGGDADPVAIALRRIRQLSAHEVGHTLGLAHNFAASTYGRASVMDYPAPLVRLTENGALDLSEAYGVGVGAWDVHTIRYGYAQFGDGVDEGAALQRIVDEGVAAKLLFLSDADARSPGTAHPAASLWDNGADAVAELRRLVKVRAVAIENFGERNVPVGEPLAHLQEAFALVYALHRYQVEAAAKVVGGLEYTYASRRAGQPIEAARPVDAMRQLDAVDALLDCLEPGVLRVPPRIRALLLPRPFGASRNREMFDARTGGVFDVTRAVTAAADHVFATLLHPARCARLAQASDDAVRLGSILQRIERRVARDDRKASGPDRRLRALVARRFAARLLVLASRGDDGPVRDAVVRSLDRVGRVLGRDRALKQMITLWWEEGRLPAGLDVGPVPLPPGSPIGHGCGCSHAGSFGR